jgi:flagellin
VASRNTAEAASLLQVAEGAMDQISNMLTRLKELATQAASANSGANLDKINAEGNKLLAEIDRIAESTEYAGSKLLNGTFGVSTDENGDHVVGTGGLVAVSGLQAGFTYTIGTAGGAGTMTITGTVGGTQVSQTVDVDVPTSGTNEIRFSALGLTLKIDSDFAYAKDDEIIGSEARASEFQVGAKDSTNDRIGISLGNATTNALELEDDQLLNALSAQGFMATVDTAISTLNAVRGEIGAAQNRLTYAAANLATTIENVQAAESVIRDVDMAAEMTTFTKNQILLQAGTAMLAQANMAPQAMLALFG